jgi:hypothetical protein
MITTARLLLYPIALSQDGEQPAALLLSPSPVGILLPRIKLATTKRTPLYKLLQFSYRHLFTTCLFHPPLFLTPCQSATLRFQQIRPPQSQTPSPLQSLPTTDVLMPSASPPSLAKLSRTTITIRFLVSLPIRSRLSVKALLHKRNRTVIFFVKQPSADAQSRRQLPLSLASAIRRLQPNPSVAPHVTNPTNDSFLLASLQAALPRSPFEPPAVNSTAMPTLVLLVLTRSSLAKMVAPLRSTHSQTTSTRMLRLVPLQLAGFQTTAFITF